MSDRLTNSDEDGRPARNPGSAAPRAAYSKDEVSTISAFREAALELVRWHRERADGFERKAANLLGLSGLALAVAPFAVNSVGGLDSWARTSVRWATASAAAALCVAVVGCIQTLRPRKNATSAPETEQLQNEWVRFKVDRRRCNAADIEGMFTDSLLSAKSGGEPVLTTVKQFADAKARWVGIASYAVAGAVVALTTAVFAALVGAT